MRSVLLGAVTIVLATTPAAHATLTVTNGGLWTIDTRAKAVACVAGHCESDHVQQSDDLSLPAGTMVQIVLQVLSCQALALEDYCDLAPRRKGKFKLVSCDKQALGPLLESCVPYPQFRLRRVGGFERMASDGQNFKWKSAVAFTMRASGYTVSVNIVATVEGTLVAPASTSGAPAPVTLDLAPATAPLVESLIGTVVGR